jgi:molybdenum cofactor cytidylyltransferase
MESWTTRDALRIGDHPELVAFVGGGGKTSLMFSLAAELPGRIIITTTTRILSSQMTLAPAICFVDNLGRLGEQLDRFGRCLVIGEVEGDKARGVDPGLPALLLARDDVDTVLVEADGSRMKPVKAPAAHEPAIPEETTLVVPVGGLDALEGPLEKLAHRSELIRRTLGPLSVDFSDELLILDNDRLTPAGLARLLTHPDGGLKNVPQHARVIPWLNKAENNERLAWAQTASSYLLQQPRIDRVVIGATRFHPAVREVRRRVTAVIPAAGQSTRMGRNKLLLPWGRTTVLEQTLANIAASAVHNVIVVTGYDPEPVTALATAAGVPVLHNPGYAAGMITSIQTAVRQIDPAVAAVLVVLGDQPLVGPDVIDTLLAAYASSPQGLVAPYHNGERGNPVLIDRRYFPELMALPIGSAPRLLLQHHSDDIRKVMVGTPVILYDLDRPEDYDRWKP